MTVGRDVVPVVTPAPVALVAVREPAASFTSRRVPAATVVLAVVAATAVALALTTRPPLTRPVVTPVTARGVPATTLVLPVIAPVASRGVATATVVLPVVAATAVALALPARPPLTRPVITPVTSRRVPATTLVLAVVAATAVALALPARPPLTRPVITPVTSRRVPATTVVLTVAAGPVGGSAVLGVASARFAVASRTALPLVETASGLGAGPVALAPGSSAGPAVAGMSVPTLVPGPVLERLGHVPLLCADAVPVGSRGCRRWPENGPP